MTPGWISRACAAVLFASLLAVPVRAEEFPFDRDLILDARRMGATVKRVPILNIEPDGHAVIDLWCKTVEGRIAFDGDTLRIEAPPLADALPQIMAKDQCTPERMQADGEVYAVLTQATQWRIEQGFVVLSGPPGALRYRLSSH